MKLNAAGDCWCDVTVKYFADIRTLTGREEEQWAAPAPTLRALLAAVGTAYGSALSRRLFDGGELHGAINVLVNGRNVAHLAGLDTRLGQDDVVAIFPMVAGG